MTHKEEILEITIRVLTNKIDEFLSECLDENKNPKLPSKRSIMNMCGYLPSHCTNTLIRK